MTPITEELIRLHLEPVGQKLKIRKTFRGRWIVKMPCGAKIIITETRIDVREVAKYLSGVDLEGSDLRNADFFGAIFAGAKLAGADLRGAEVSGLDLATLATSSGLKITMEQQYALLSALGIDVHLD